MRSSSYQSKDLRVLAVDDEPSDLEYIGRVLRRNGFEVVEARNAEEAMEVMNQGPFAVLVTDLWMPGINGDELGRWAKERFPNLEVIIVTAEGTVDTASKAVRFGASDYLAKPLEMKTMVESISRAMEKYREKTNSSGQLQALQARSGFMSDIMDRLPQGVILVNVHCKVLQTNRTAEDILCDRDGLVKDRGGRLTASHSDDTMVLRGLVQKASANDQASPTGGAMTIVRPSGGPSLSLMVTPLDPKMDTGELDEPVVSVFVTDPGHQAPKVGMLCKLYGMTPAEARLATHLAGGGSLDQASAAWGVKVSTVRTHLKRIFAKTETSRQADLVRLLLSGPAMLSAYRDGDEDE